MLRFDFKITKQNKAGSWTKAEDKQLLELIDRFGPKWALVGWDNDDDDEDEMTIVAM